MPKIDEFHIQRAFVTWFAGNEERHIIGARLPGIVSWHVPNQGAGRDARQGKFLKEMGVVAGIPDYHILWGGLYVVEFKRPKQGRQSDSQNKMRPQMLGAGLVDWLTTNSVREAVAFVTRHKLVRPDAVIPPFAC